MAIVSYGYGVDSENTEGEIGVIQWAQLATYMGAEFATSAGSFVPSIPPSGDRTVSLTAGEGASYGVFFISDAAATVTFAAPSSGTRWYVAGLHLDWTARTTTLVELGYGGTISSALAGLERTAADVVDMPLVACRVVAGQAKVQEIVDLRLFGSGCTFTARSVEVMNFVTRPGTLVTIDDIQYQRVVTPAGSQKWLPLNYLDIPWASSTLDSAGLQLLREYRIKNGQVTFRASGKATANLTGVDRLILTFSNTAYHPPRTVYGTVWVGYNSYRAYVTTAGEVHLEPLTIPKDSTIQVYIVWPQD